MEQTLFEFGMSLEEPDILRYGEVNLLRDDCWECGEIRNWVLDHVPADLEVNYWFIQDLSYGLDVPVWHVCHDHDYCIIDEFCIPCDYRRNGIARYAFV